MKTNVASLLVAAAERSPGHPAVEEATGAVSYADLRRLMEGYRSAYVASGVQRGDRVAVLLDRGIHAAAALSAAQAEGMIAVVLNERLRARQVQHILSDCAASLLVTTADLLARSAVTPPSYLRTLDPAVVGPNGPTPLAVVAPDHPAHVIYTSGSTGLPKGVVHTHGSIGFGVAQVHRYLGLRGDDRVASLLALSAVYGLNQLLCSFAVASTLVVDHAVFPADLVRAIRARRMTVVAGVPPLWSQLVATAEFSEPLPALRQMQNAGGHLPIQMVRRLRSAQPQAELMLQYGMTETWRGTYLPPTEVDQRPGSIGRAIPGVEILVCREDGTLCAPGEVGELVHVGRTVAAGYWGVPFESQTVFRRHALRPSEPAVYSGDFARKDEAGFLYYVGRRDRIIKSQGMRVGPDEVADALLTSGQVSEAVVTGEPDQERGQRVVAWVVLAEGGTLAQLKRYARAELPSYMQPARYELREALPRLMSGKYDLLSLERRDSGDDLCVTAE